MSDAPSYDRPYFAAIHKIIDTEMAALKEAGADPTEEVSLLLSFLITTQAQIIASVAGDLQQVETNLEITFNHMRELVTHIVADRTAGEPHATE